MTTTELIMSIVSGLSMVITAILAWVSIYKTNRVSVSFVGTPVDVKECERRTSEQKEAEERRAHEITTLAAKVAAEREADAAANKKDRGDLYNHIDSVRKELKSDIQQSDTNTRLRLDEVLGAVNHLAGKLEK
jgi:flagellar biosynthesis component FlhA